MYNQRLYLSINLTVDVTANFPGAHCEQYVWASFEIYPAVQLLHELDAP